MSEALEDVWRPELPHVLAALTRRYGRFADCEDAVQEAALAAVAQWPTEGRPDDSRAWLLRVASRRVVDQLRRDDRRRAREERAARLERAGTAYAASPAAPDAGADPDEDLLQLMLLCCHPALSRSSQVALTLRAVAGLSTRQVAAGFMVPEATMGQRISRAKATLADAGARLEPPAPRDLPGRVLAVRHAISLLYTQGQLRHDGTQLRATAVSLARQLHRSVPRDPENAGLLALLLLSEARTPAVLDDAGDLVPLEEQDRGRWDRELIGEGVRLLEATLPQGYVGAFALQAAIAAVHAEAPAPADTDWPQVLALYEMLQRVAPSTASTIGWATAVAEVHGAAAGLEALETVADTRHHRYHAVRGHLLARSGEVAGARASFAHAARATRSIPEQRYLNRVVAALDAGGPGEPGGPGGPVIGRRTRPAP